MPAKETEFNQTLRQRAEAKLNSTAAATQKVLTLDEANLLLHELQVHQIELELQNEELRSTQAELHAAKARYFDLYDLAPVGYCTLSEQGVILEANLNAGTLLGVARGALVKQPISRFILKEDYDLYYLHSKQLFANGEPQSEELRMVKNDGTALWMHLVATVAQDGHGASVCHIALNDVTDRKQAEETLYQTKALLQAAMDQSPAGIAIADAPEGTLRYVNNAGLLICGGDDQAKVNGDEGNHNVATFQLFDLDGRPLADDEAPLSRAIMFGETSRREFIVRRAANDDRIVSVNAAPVRDEYGKVVAGIEVFNDVTERKQAEKELALQGRIGKIFLTIPDDEMFDEVLAVILDVLHSPFGVFGYLDEAGALVVPTMTMQIWETCQVPDKTIRFPRETWGSGIWPRAIREKRVLFSNEPSSNIPKGHIGISRNIAVPILLQGEVVGLFQVANKETDYTGADLRTLEAIAGHVAPILEARLKRKRTEEQLACLSRHHELILCSVEEGILGLDLQANHTFINPAAAKMLGYKGEELLGCPSHSTWHHTKADGSHYPKEECLIETAFRDGFEYRRSSEVFWRKDGSSFPVEYASTPIYEQGRLVGAVLTFADITGRKLAEEEKAKLQTQLNQAQKMEAIGALAGGIAHDFNNLLTVILGYTEMVMTDAPPGSGFAQDLDKVLTAAHRATDLVKQILTFSRQSTAERMPIRIQPLVKESLKMLRSSIPSTISINENIDPQCGAILADPTQVHQIVMNLCTNAFHAMEYSGGMLSVGLKTIRIDSQAPLAVRQLKPDDYIELTVSDTGTGIGTDIVAKIFDPYFTTKGVGKGTGMGLAIAHGIITSYGGAITVESTVGQGATFHVYFPVIQEKGKVFEECKETPRGKERILFVDDEELIAEMGKDMLERLGYTVTGQNRSIEALAAFMDDPNQFDLVITDLTMPGLTGVELAKQILQIRPDIPIILCTGFSQLIDEESAKAIGIQGFALKPLTKSSVAILMRKLLDGGAAS